MKALKVTLALGSLLFAGSLTAQTKLEFVKKHIEYLSSDILEGRGTSSMGEGMAAKYIANYFAKLKLDPKGSNGYYYAFKFKKNPDPHDTSTAGIKEREGLDVIGFLDNGAEYTVVIGAHYDHLGLGHDHNSQDANPEGKIHNGADDNASGTAGVFELARYYATNNIKEKFNFLFMAFSGEELGLYGSKKWCDEPTYPLDRIDYMINMDMIGRLNDSTRKLLIYGVGTAPEFVEVLDRANYRDANKKFRTVAEETDSLGVPYDNYFSLKKDSAGIGPSDQTSFYLKNIPVLHFFTGQHSDYHKPSDDADKINYVGETEVLNYIIRVEQELEKYPKLKFLETRTTETRSTKFKVTLGVMPDYTFEGKGMKIDGVTNGKPASKAGIKKGDIVIKMGDVDVNDMKGYMEALSKFNKGDKAKVKVLRGKEEKEFEVEF